METAKRLITGIFRKNDELRDVDDDIFIALIRSGIEEAGQDNNTFYEDLLSHALKLYVDAWLADAETDEDFDRAQETKNATETFMRYFKEDESIS
jgi:hypothetical protein